MKYPGVYFVFFILIFGFNFMAQSQSKFRIQKAKKELKRITKNYNPRCSNGYDSINLIPVNLPLIDSVESINLQKLYDKAPLFVEEYVFIIMLKYDLGLKSCEIIYINFYDYSKDNVIAKIAVDLITNKFGQKGIQKNKFLTPFFAIYYTEGKWVFSKKRTNRKIKKIISDIDYYERKYWSY